MTSTDSTARPSSPDDPSPDPHLWLAAAAEVLEARGEHRSWQPMLAGVVEPGSAGHRCRIEVADIDHPDPVEGLLGFVAPRRLRAVGLVAGGRTQALDDDDRPPARGGFVHLVDRDGTSVTRTVDAEGRSLVIGPAEEVQVGRVPDACRRALGLDTALPPPDTTAVVVDAWLEKLLAVALRHPDLSWPEVVDLQPGSNGACTPGELAGRLSALGQELTWDLVRRGFLDGVIAARHGIDAALAGWMDDGMLARWLIGAAIPWSSQLEIVDALLAPEVSDLVAATVGMCPPPSWPEP